jgi:hypothetical protein
VGFDKVDQEVLRQRLLDRLIIQRVPALEAELFNAAAVDIRSDTLREQFNRRHRTPR